MGLYLSCPPLRPAVLLLFATPRLSASSCPFPHSQVFCELVQGLGESLVSGMIAGSAVAFKASKSALDAPETLCYASKSEGMFVRDSLIFRSDSNGEDLEGYAGGW